MLAHDEVRTKGDIQHPAQCAGKYRHGGFVDVGLTLCRYQKQTDDKYGGDEYCQCLGEFGWLSTCPLDHVEIPQMGSGQDVPTPGDFVENKKRRNLKAGTKLYINVLFCNIYW